MTLSTKELTTTLTALRLLQREIEQYSEAGIKSFAGEDPILDADQIDDLCEKINTDVLIGIQVMHDWRVAEDPDSLQPGDDREYSLNYRLGNQNYLRISNTHDETVLDLMLEINHGVPALHISDQNSDALLHIHRANGGLVLTPDNQDNNFLTSTVDRFSYNQGRSITIK